MVEGMNIREGARTFGLHRDTVRKMLAYSVPPGYRRQTPPRRHQRYFRRAIAPRPLDCGLGPLPWAGVFLPLLLLACGGSDEAADGPSSEPTTAKEEGVFRIFEQEGVSWIFKESLPLFDTSLIRRYPSVNWERVTYLLYWSLRISVFALPVLLFIVSHIRKFRRSAEHFAGYPQAAEGLTTLPSDLPAPAVSVLGSRKVGPKTYLSILVDMFQKGNLTITGGYDESDKKRRLHSRVWFTRQFEPDQPWEKEVYSALPFLSASDLLKPNSDMLKSKLEGRRKAIGTHLDECLRSRGIFDEPPLSTSSDYVRVMDQRLCQWSLCQANSYPVR